MSYLSFQTCVTCHGTESSDLFRALLNNEEGPKAQSEDTHEHFTIKMPENLDSYEERLLHWMDFQIQNFKDQWNFAPQEKWGVIFASTKGIIEDLIWQDDVPQFDPYHCILEKLEQSLPVKVYQSLCVSNACTSSHGAIELAQRWIKRKQVDHVYIFAADLIGPFTLKGFSSLRALSEKRTLTPFDQERDGLLLGDGIASIVISAEPKNKSDCFLSPVTTLCEGVSATRPDTSGKNLAHCLNATSPLPTDVVIAHGTGTHYNDMTESKALYDTFHNNQTPLVTCTKWNVGHTLGASGLVDLCAANEALKTQSIYGISTLRSSDLEISDWLIREARQTKIQNILISSLGFGGMCSALQIQKRGPL